MHYNLNVEIDASTTKNCIIILKIGSYNYNMFGCPDTSHCKYSINDTYNRANIIIVPIWLFYIPLKIEYFPSKIVLTT